MEQTEITFTINERCVRALHSAVAFTLEKWAVGGEVDPSSGILINGVYRESE